MSTDTATVTDSTAMAALTRHLRRCAVGVAGVTFALSFYGLFDFARQSMKLPVWLAWIVPAGLDGLTLVAIAATFLLRHKAIRVRAYAWLVFGVAAGLSMAGNHQHAVTQQLDDSGTAGFTVAPVILALAAHLVVVTWRNLERPDKNTAATSVTSAKARPATDKTSASNAPAKPATAASGRPATAKARQSKKRADKPADSQAEMLRLRAAGKKPDEIATELGVSERTVWRRLSRSGAGGSDSPATDTSSAADDDLSDRALEG